MTSGFHFVLLVGAHHPVIRYIYDGDSIMTYEVIPLVPWCDLVVACIRSHINALRIISTIVNNFFVPQEFNFTFHPLLTFFFLNSCSMQQKLLTKSSM